MDPKSDSILELQTLQTLPLEGEVRPPVELEKEATPSPAEDVKPDGGFQAWKVVLGGFLAMFMSVGLSNCFGVYQVFFEERWPNTSWSSIATIGGIWVCFADWLGPLAGAMADSFGIRVVAGTGVAVMAVGLVLLSVSNSYWSTLLSLGVVVGIGEACVAVSISILPQWFDQRKGLALSIVLCGLGAGGFSWTLISEYLNDHAEDNRDRISAAILLAVGIVATFLLENRNHVRQRFTLRKLIPQFSHLKNRSFLWLCISKAAGFFGVFGFFFFFPVLAKKVIHSSVGNWIWAVSHLCANFGRLSGGFLGDRIGICNAYVLTAFIITIITWSTFLPIADEASAITFAILFGISYGAWSSLAESTSMHVTQGFAGSACGLTSLFSAWTPLVAAPLGALLRCDEEKRPFLYAGILWCCGFSICSVTAVLCRVTHRPGHSWRARV